MIDFKNLKGFCVQLSYYTKVIVESKNVLLILVIEFHYMECLSEKKDNPLRLKL
jgi:hypothetical protein